MVVLVTGGAGSGKSAIAEEICMRLSENSNPAIYIATMKIWDNECQKRVEKHRNQRAGKNFITFEIPERLSERVREIKAGSVVLLECMSNLLANEQFGGGNTENIYMGIDKLISDMKSVVIVTNEIFTDVKPKDIEMRKYIENLGKINQYIAEKSDIVIEAISGISYLWKGEKRYSEMHI